jgi:hypothetical protein
MYGMEKTKAFLPEIENKIFQLAWCYNDYVIPISVVQKGRKIYFPELLNNTEYLCQYVELFYTITTTVILLYFKKFETSCMAVHTLHKLMLYRTLKRRYMRAFFTEQTSFLLIETKLTNPDNVDDSFNNFFVLYNEN